MEMDFSFHFIQTRLMLISIPLTTCLLSLCFILPITHPLVVVKIHQKSWYQPVSSCAFIRNVSWTNDVVINSCIWECVNEIDCQTAVFFQNDKNCSLFKELCTTGHIESFADNSRSVICYKKEHAPIATCSSTAAPNQANEKSSPGNQMVLSTEAATTNFFCGSTCVNTTTSTASTLAFYSFDFTVTDATGNYSPHGSFLPTYVPGWVGFAANFTASNGQYLSTGNIPLNLCSFTIEFWFYATDISAWDYSFMGEYLVQAQDQCLFINIRNQKLFFGFFGDDTSGNTNLVINKWYHGAFVYDDVAHQRYIYLNGVLDKQTGVVNGFLGWSVPFTIGGAKIGGSTSLYVYYSGIIDHVTVSSRAKTACEIYLDANLACYFTFDSTSPITDSGPNFLTANNTGATAVIGRVNQAIQFSSPLSYITVNGISALNLEYNCFSISMWIKPTNVAGGATLIHASTQSDGQGTCLIMWGLTSNGIMTVNVMDTTTQTTFSATASSPLLLNTWTHIAQTFSSTNGNRLYINGILVTNVIAPTGHSVGPYTIIGASPNNTNSCSAGSIARGQFFGMIDEYRVFGVELTSTDVCRLAHP